MPAPAASTPGVVLALASARPGTPGTSHPASPRSAAPTPDRSGLWLRPAAAGLCVLAAAAAVVSFTAQYRMADAARHLPAVAALEAAIPDAAALVFASLGIALALHGHRAIRARTLNLASVAASVAMNVLAATPGWRNLAIWALPPIAYALARCPAAPSPHRLPTRARPKTARFLTLATERHGPLASIPLTRVAAISAALAPHADLNTGAARTALRKAILSAQNGDQR